MQPKFRTEATLTKEDFRYLYKTNLLRSQGPKMGSIIAVIAVIVAVAAWFIAKSAEKSPTFAVVLALIVMAAFCFMIIKNLTGEIDRIAAGQIAAHEEKYPDIPYTVVNEVSEDAILTGLKTEEEKTEIFFSDISKVICAKEAVICTTKTTGQSLFFKKETFTDGTFEDFKIFIKDKTKKSK